MLARLRVMCLGLGILSTVLGCAVAPPADAPPAVAPLPYVHPPYAAGNSRSDTYQTSPYEQKMDEEELAYRRRRSTQEREQELKYQQWEQERARERDPRYEGLR
jgi:hypothetical protein